MEVVTNPFNGSPTGTLVEHSLKGSLETTEGYIHIYIYMQPTNPFAKARLFLKLLGFLTNVYSKVRCIE